MTLSSLLPKERLSQILAVVFCFGMFTLLIMILWPHASALVGALTLGLSFYPLHRWIQRRLSRKHPSLHALLSTLLVVFFLVVPLMAMAWAAVGQSPAWAPTLRNWQETMGQWREGTIVDSTPTMRSFRGWMWRTFAVQPGQLRLQVAQIVEGFLKTISDFGTAFSAGVAASVGELGLMVVALFFIFRDGQGLYARFENYLPFEEHQKQECKKRVYDIVTGVARGWLLTSIVQGVLATLGYALAGVKGWILFGFITMLAGLIPFIGTALVWLPLAVVSIMNGSPAAGIFLLTWGVFVVSLVDNFLRPYIVGRRTHIPFVFLLFALLGGVELWGIKGIVLGPVIVALAPVVFDMFGHRPENAAGVSARKPEKPNRGERVLVG